MVQVVTFKSTILKNRRRIFIYVPPGAEITRGPTLPVLYMQDGQNLFSNTCHEVPYQWDLDVVVSQLMEEERIPRMLIVGIENTATRTDEYTPTRCHHFGCGGKADRYLDFITQELAPFVKENYPVNTLRTATALGGSSLGGLLALYGAFTRPHDFGRFIASSPSIWWDRFAIFRVLEYGGLDSSLIKLWVDVGRREMKSVRYKGKYFSPLRLYRNFDHVLQLFGFVPESNYTYFEERLGTHDERSWQRRMYRAMPFMFSDLTAPALTARRDDVSSSTCEGA